MRKMFTIVGLRALGACQTAQPALEPALSDDLGSAVKANIAAMAIVPTEAQREDTFIPQDRARRDRAVRSYREGTTPEPRNLRTRGN